MRVFDQLIRKFHKRRFDSRCRMVLDTPPVILDESSKLAVLSQTYNADLYMYLVAAKSFAKHVPPALFIIVDDGLSPENKQLIERHLKRVEFIPRKSVANDFCPAGGCWERFLTIADWNAQHYIVQLDSDTVTVGCPEVVRNAVQAGQSFTLSTKMGRDFIPVETAASDAMKMDGSHIQVLAEQALGRIEQLKGMRYIRGCAGFSGFAQGTLSRESIESFSGLMSRQIGAERWSSWGSEQFASNFFVANAPSPYALPFEQFPYWAPDASLNEARLIHFIGDHRFTSGKYAKVARKAILDLGR